MDYEDTCCCILISERHFLALPILQRGCRQGRDQPSPPVLPASQGPRSSLARASTCLAYIKPWEPLTRNKILIREVWTGLRCGAAALGDLTIARGLVTGFAEPPVRARLL